MDILITFVLNILLLFLSKNIFVGRLIFGFCDISEMQYYNSNLITINIYQILSCCVMCLLVIINNKLFTEFYILGLLITFCYQYRTSSFTLDMFQKLLSLICIVQFYIFNKCEHSVYRLFGTVLWCTILYYDMLETIFGKIRINLEKSIHQSLPMRQLKTIKILLAPMLFVVIIIEIFHIILSWNVYGYVINNIIYRTCILFSLGAKVLKFVDYYEISYFEFKNSLNKRHNINNNYERYSRK